VSEHAISAEQLVAELAAGVGLQGAWIGPEARRAAPGLVDAARAATHVSREPSGREDLACVVAGATSAAAALRSGGPAPFLILLEPPGRDGDAARIAAELCETVPGLCVRDDLTGPGPRLLAPLARLLAAPALPGSWRGAATAQDGPARPEPDEPAQLWRLVVEDRRTLDALLRERAAEAAELAQARRALQRATAEGARRQAVHQHEIAQLEQRLAQERAWVAEQARRIAGSTAWRIGHRTTRLAWRLSGRTVRGTDLPAAIARRMERADPP
jgi:hypothetical protein